MCVLQGGGERVEDVRESWRGIDYEQRARERVGERERVLENCKLMSERERERLG